MNIHIECRVLYQLDKLGSRTQYMSHWLGLPCPAETINTIQGTLESEFEIQGQDQKMAALKMDQSQYKMGDINS